MSTIIELLFDAAAWERIVHSLEERRVTWEGTSYSRSPPEFIYNSLKFTLYPAPQHVTKSLNSVAELSIDKCLGLDPQTIADWKQSRPEQDGLHEIESQFTRLLQLAGEGAIYVECDSASGTLTEVVELSICDVASGITKFLHDNGRSGVEVLICTFR